MTTDKQARKECPIARGLLDYFPLACAEVARVSFVGNQQHNPGQEMHWDRSKSSDHADCIARHLLERGMTDMDGVAHTAKVAWRALAMLQVELEAAQKPVEKLKDRACVPVEQDPQRKWLNVFNRYTYQIRNGKVYFTDLSGQEMESSYLAEELHSRSATFTEVK